jgi:hypothetical protein
VYYASKDIVITEEIVKRFDAANPVADAGASATPAARPTSSVKPAGATPKPADKTKP